jgi:hypothetical protein
VRRCGKGRYIAPAISAFPPSLVVKARTLDEEQPTSSLATGDD